MQLQLPKNVEQIIAKLEKTLGPTAAAELRANYDLALIIVANLANVSDNQSFHEWKDAAVLQMKQHGWMYADNYGQILVHIAWDQYKGQLSNPVTKFFKKVWGWVTQVGLADFIKNKGGFLLNVAETALRDALAARTNQDLRTVRDRAWAAVQTQLGEYSKTWIGLGIEAAIAVLRAKGVWPTS